jgi:UDP-N-acetylmuramate--alanine ligase
MIVTTVDLDDIKKIYFIGIGGTSMSGLAMMSLANGFEVSGSDMRPCVYTDKLKAKGITVYIGHDADNVPKDADLVVYSSAIHLDNPEIVRANALGLPIMERSYYLGALSRLYPDTIAISGTHGKTTTSSLISLMLFNADYDPSISIGGTLEKIGGNSRVGDSRYFVIEACEFVDSFLHSRHSLGIILNIEEDHLDYFTQGIEQITQSFLKFAQIIPRYGLLIANGDEPNVRRILSRIKCRIQTFGFGKDNMWRAENIVYDKLGKPTFDVYKNNAYYSTFFMNIPGAHNVMNALSVIACGDYLKSTPTSSATRCPILRAHGGGFNLSERKTASTSLKTMRITRRNCASR